MSLADTIRRTECYLREEIAAQGRLLELLETQERAVRRGATKDVLSANRRYEEELHAGAARDGVRRALLREFAAFYGVDPRTLTLSSLARRLGEHGAPLAEAREELRAAAGRVLRASRRLSTLARYHRGIVEEVLGLLQPDEPGAGRDGRGALVHVEA